MMSSISLRADPNYACTRLASASAAGAWVKAAMQGEDTEVREQISKPGKPYPPPLLTADPRGQHIQLFVGVMIRIVLLLGPITFLSR